MRSWKCSLPGRRPRSLDTGCPDSTCSGRTRILMTFLCQDRHTPYTIFNATIPHTIRHTNYTAHDTHTHTHTHTHT
ncbi:hypothetical protein EON63_18065, partial [archaeon]